MLNGRFSWNDIGCTVAAILFLQFIKIHRKAFYRGRDFLCRSLHLKANGNTVVVRKWKFHLAGMMDAAIHPKIASL